jgi:hypothetical protein
MPVYAGKAAPAGLGGSVMRSHLAIILGALLTATPAMAQKLPVPSPEPLPKHVSSGGCPTTFAPVCAKKNGNAKGYRNACLAKSDGAADVKLGQCSPGD